jgi:hypothetical protein
MKLLIFSTRRCLHLLAFIAFSFFLHFVCLICRKIIGRLGLVVVPILTYSHVSRTFDQHTPHDHAFVSHHSPIIYFS